MQIFDQLHGVAVRVVERGESSEPGNLRLVAVEDHPALLQSPSRLFEVVDPEDHRPARRHRGLLGPVQREPDRARLELRPFVAGPMAPAADRGRHRRRPRRDPCRGSSSRRGRWPRGAPRAACQPRILRFCAWNSSSVRTPRARRSASRSSSEVAECDDLAARSRSSSAADSARPGGRSSSGPPRACGCGRTPDGPPRRPTAPRATRRR